ncbi:MAG: flagellar protein FlgN [Puniceicoccaceae bacterium]
MNFYDENWDALAGKLRNEIEAYGRLFELLEEQRNQFIKNDLDGLTTINNTVTLHTDVIHNLKQEREALVQDIWDQTNRNGQPITVKELLKHSPQQSWPLFEELLGEVNRLIDQTQHQLEKNQMLLRRSLELGQKFLNMLVPTEADSTPVYAYNGQSNRSAENIPISRYHKHA